MSTQSDLLLIQNVVEALDRNRVARFSYEQRAFDNDTADGVDVFDRSAPQNIPKADKTDYNPTVTDKGIRSQGASIPRMGWNHYLGRISYNLNKSVQKLLAFFGILRAAFAHNANEYDQNARYRPGDICFTVEKQGSVSVYAWHIRVSVSPGTISGIPPTVALHWAEMQERTSFSSLLPLSAPGFRHTFTVIDLSSGQAGKWYPVTTAVQDFDIKPEAQGGSPQTVIEAFCNGPVSWSSDACRAELSLLSRFTGAAGSSTDILLGNTYMNTVSGAALPVPESPIGFSKLPKGRQAVLWLRGGTKYALWNSFGSVFSLHTSQYSNGLDPDVLLPVAERPWAPVFGSLKARLKTPAAVEDDDAVNKGQAAGSLPLPKTLTQASNLRSVRSPGIYIPATVAAANSILETPIRSPGIFELTVSGDEAGLSITTQRILLRETGDEYTRVLLGALIVVPWYLSASPKGTDIGVSGLYRFEVKNGDLIMHYRTGDEVPAFHINDTGELEAYIA